jgi:Mrp family chromosome partitioning ATPase
MQQRVLSHDRSLGEPTSVLPAAAPPPSALALADAEVAGATPQLPAEVTTMVGRDEDVAAVTGLLATHRVLTLTGPGGVGKTRVALAVARQTPQPVWFVDLTPVDSADKVATAVATVLGVTTRPDVSPG